MHIIDYVIVAVYLVVVLLVGVYYSLRIKSVSDYAVAGRNYPTAVIVATIFATIIGGASTIGVAEQFFSVGIIFFAVCIAAVLRDVITAQFIVPQMGDITNFISTGDIMGSYFGKPGKIITGIAVFLRCTIAVGTQVSALGFLGNYFLGIPYMLSAVGASAIIILYSSFGGIRSVTITDVIQFGVMIVAIPMICNFGLNAVGGFAGIVSSIPSSRLTIPDDPLIIFKYGSLALAFLIPDLDPAIIQRILMGKNLQQGRLALYISSYASLPIYALVGIIGFVALTISPNLEPSLALPFLLNNVLPIGIKGLAISGILAVIMSTADSYLNIGGIALVHDVIVPLRQENISDKNELVLMKLTTFFLGIGAICFALFIPNVFSLTVASLSLWKPVIFPPMLMGMLGLLKNQKLFYIGITSSILTMIIWNNFIKNWLIIDGIFIATTIHFVILSSPAILQKYSKNKVLHLKEQSQNS